MSHRILNHGGRPGLRAETAYEAMHKDAGTAGISDPVFLQRLAARLARTSKLEGAFPLVATTMLYCFLPAEGREKPAPE